MLPVQVNGTFATDTVKCEVDIGTLAQISSSGVRISPPRGAALYRQSGAIRPAPPGGLWRRGYFLLRHHHSAGAAVYMLLEHMMPKASASSELCDIHSILLCWLVLGSLLV